MKINAQITILFDRDRGMTIELYDKDAAVTFADVRLTAEQVVSALSRMSHTECEAEVYSLDKVGKTQENKTHVFEYPAEWGIRAKDNREELKELAQQTAPEGWVSGDYFDSQDSFFEKDGKRFARVTIRRWV